MSPEELSIFLIYSGAAVTVIAATVVVSHLLGERHDGKAAGEPYESGVASTGSAELRFSAKFYLVAMLFVIFDLEAAILFAWAVGVREAGWAGFAGAMFFLLVLGLALAYEWREGALDIGPKPRRERARAASRTAGR